MTDSTLAYYERFGGDFIASTIGVCMTEHHDRFLAHVPPGGAILDLGCGSGRDSLAFLEAGYDVTSVDGSATMVSATSALTGRPARMLRFDELDYVQAFDGVWACASLLHVPMASLADVMGKALLSLRAGGVLYTSFKIGDGDRVEKGRHFTDFTSAAFRAWVAGLGLACVEEMWETADVREGRSHEGWVNVILRSAGR